ncbi:hypothetical protein NL676_003049 [Syzygium grande]|nr:hypothetical protein NL676_003049 [Syzygium grande]
MQLANVAGNAATVSSSQSVCAELAALNLGWEVHGHVVWAFMNHNLPVANSSITMYMRCGCPTEESPGFTKLDVK